MSRIRTIKPEFCTSDDITALTRDARLLFALMWMFCDDAGRHVASTRLLKREVFPDDDLEPGDMERWVAELTATGLLLPYSVDGRDYWQVTGWHHQRIDRPTVKFPAPPDSEDSASVLRVFGETSPPESSRVESSRKEGKGVEGKGVEGKGKKKNSSSSSSSSFWEGVKKRAKAVGVTLNSAKRMRYTRDMKSLILHACGLVEMGEMPDAWLTDAIDAVVSAETITNPTGFLADRLTKYAAQAGKDFAVMRRALTIPEDLLASVKRKPTDYERRLAEYEKQERAIELPGKEE
ncbi:MAG TPA: hypothetical protein VMX74_00840 [Pirellulales bacterium]|nr:hypothetical protein [Pirellulales bacterium]